MTSKVGSVGSETIQQVADAGRRLSKAGITYGYHQHLLESKRAPGPLAMTELEEKMLRKEIRTSADEYREAAEEWVALGYTLEEHHLWLQLSAGYSDKVGRGEFDKLHRLTAEAFIAVMGPPSGG